MGYYEAQMSFTHPGVTRRFRQHVVYELDDDVVELLAPAIAKGRLRPLSGDEVEGYLRLVRPVGQATTDGGSDDGGDGAQVPPPPFAAEQSPAQDPGGQGDDGDATPPDAATTPSSPASSEPYDADGAP